MSMAQPPVLVPNSRHVAAFQSASDGLGSSKQRSSIYNSIPSDVKAAFARQTLPNSLRTGSGNRVAETDPMSSTNDLLGFAESFALPPLEICEGESAVAGLESLGRAAKKRKGTHNFEDDLTNHEQVTSAKTNTHSIRFSAGLPVAPAEPNPVSPSTSNQRHSIHCHSPRDVSKSAQEIVTFSFRPRPFPSSLHPRSRQLTTMHSTSSLFPSTKGRFEDPEDELAQHYEKLEHVGDSILGMLVTTWLHETKPRLTCGTATKLKAHLVSNATLSHISGLCGFPARLRGKPDLLPMLRSSTDTRAAIVEAYIAALYFSFASDQRVSHAIPAIDKWLRDMYSSLVDFFYDHMKAEHDRHFTFQATDAEGRVLSTEERIEADDKSMGMATLLNAYATQQDRAVRWEEAKVETKLGPLWRFRCAVDGIELGDATRALRKVAKNVAGWQAAKKLGLVNDEPPLTG